MTMKSTTRLSVAFALASIIAACGSPPGETAGNPVLKVVPTELDFGTTQSGPLIFTVSNAGTGKMAFRVVKQDAWLAINTDWTKTRTEIVASTTTQDMVYAVTIDRNKLGPNESQAQVLVIPDVGASQTILVRATSDKCTAGLSRCTDALNIAFCGNDGKWQAAQLCGDGKYCDRPTSQCRAQQCKPNEYKCFSASSSQQCSADGSSWQAPMACPGGQVCIEASGTCSADTKPTITGIEGDGSKRAVVDYRGIVPASADNVVSGYRLSKALNITGTNLTKVNDDQTRLDCATNKNVFFTTKEGLTFEQGGTDMKRKLWLPATLAASACTFFVLTVANGSGSTSAQVYVLQGEPGVASLIDVQAEPAGANCAGGGQKVLSGLDVNGDGTLAANEVTTTKYLCNGKNGADGANGTNGAQGPKGLDGAVPGTVVAFAGSKVPDGWLLCDGSAVSRTAFAALYAAIGTSHGSGDNVVTFNLPDYQGRFLRGVSNGVKDNGVPRDPDAKDRKAMGPNGNDGDKVGSIEGDQFMSHTHSYNTYAGCVASGPYCFPSGEHDYNQGPLDLGTRGAGGSETRPKNASVNYIIKY